VRNAERGVRSRRQNCYGGYPQALACERILRTYFLLLATLSSNEVLLKSRHGRDAPQAKRSVS
jgi:hypothetical protein